MKQVKFLLTILGAVLLAGSIQVHAQGVPDMKSKKARFGAAISTKDAIPAAELPAKLEGIDSMWVRVTGEVLEVCQNKGCWMTMSLGEDQTMRVRFKDYGFFVPKNCSGAVATMEGWAFRRMIPVDELRHYAQDAGKSKAEIEAITQPREEFVFYADGVVLIRKRK